MNIPVLHIVILVLACWRLASLFANESGPKNIFGKIRDWVDKHSAHFETPIYRDGKSIGPIYTQKPGSLIDGLSCEWCNSIWFGTVLVAAYLLIGPIILWPCLILVLSTGAIFIKFVIQTLEAKKAELEAIKAEYDRLARPEFSDTYQPNVDLTPALKSWQEEG